MSGEDKDYRTLKVNLKRSPIQLPHQFSILFLEKHNSFIGLRGVIPSYFSKRHCFLCLVACSCESLNSEKFADQNL